MRRVTWLTVLSLAFVLLTGFGRGKPDAEICTFIKRDPIETSVSFCVNGLTRKERDATLAEMEKWVCFPNNDYPKWRDYWRSQKVRDPIE